MEEWRFIKGYNNKYLVSNWGRVISLDNSTGEPMILGQCPGGQLAKVHLKDGLGKRRRVAVHRLVAEAFLENPNKWRYVKHISNNLFDNSVGNLYWNRYA